MLDNMPGVPTFFWLLLEPLHSVVGAAGAGALVLGTRKLGFRHGHQIPNT